MYNLKVFGNMSPCLFFEYCFFPINLNLNPIIFASSTSSQRLGRCQMDPWPPRPWAYHRATGLAVNQPRPCTSMGTTWTWNPVISPDSIHFRGPH